MHTNYTTSLFLDVLSPAIASEGLENITLLFAPKHNYK